MKRLLLAAALAAAPTGALAQDQDEDDRAVAPFARTLYVGVGLGAGSVTEDGAVNTFTDVFGDFGTPGETVVIEGALDYETGFAGSLLLGYALTPNISIEAETTGRTNDFDGNVGDTDFSVSTLMGGVVLSGPVDAGVVPYVGVAGGLVSSNLDGADNAFGYQLKGGLSVRVSGPHSIGVEVSHVSADGFEVDVAPGDVLELDYANTAVMATYRFMGLGAY